MDTYAARLAPIILPEARGDYVRLGELWQERPRLVAFLRHYG